jgi:S-layer protein
MSKKKKVGTAVSGLATFDALLNAAVASADGGGVAWFTLGGDTYVVQDSSVLDGTTFADGSDTVAKLAGIHNLAASTHAGADLLIV